MRTPTKCRCVSDGVERVQTIITGESMTRTDQADMVNINNIYKRTQRGEIVLASDVMPRYDDFEQINSYDAMLEAINEAEESFMELPSDERKKYGNDPAKYYESVMKEAHANEVSRLNKIAEDEETVAKEKAIAEAKALLGENKESS